MNKNFKFSVAVIAACASCMGLWRSYDYKVNSSPLLLENIEALADDSENKDKNCYLHHFDCKISATGKLAAIFKVKVGATVDLTDLTQFFNYEKTGGEGPCSCGDDITCNDAVHSL